MHRIDVLIANTPLSIDEPFSYIYDKPLNLGALVVVSFAHRQAFGFVVSCSELDEHKHSLKSIQSVINENAFTLQQYEYACWLSQVCFKPVNQLLNQMIIAPLRNNHPFDKIKQTTLRINPNYSEKLTVKQQMLQDYMGNQKLSQKQLVQHFNKSFIRNCLQKGLLLKEANYPNITKSTCLDATIRPIVFPMKKVSLVKDCYRDFNKFIAPIILGQLNNNNKVLIMVPNAKALNSVKSIVDYYFNHVISYTSSYANLTKLNVIYALNHGANLIVATSSILLLDCEFDCVIVLESQQRSYDYASFAHVPLNHCLNYMHQRYGSQIINVSLTPTITQINDTALIKDESELSLNVELVDMQMHYRSGKGILSKQVLQAIDQSLKQGKTCFVWVNRLGSYRLVKCMQCGSPLTCSHCGRLLTYSDLDHGYHCYHCNVSFQLNECPQCRGTNFSYANIGVERMQLMLSTIFKHTKVLLCDSNHPLSNDKLESKTILVGTNAILNYPTMQWDTLIGIDVDSYISSKDYLSNEKSMIDIFSLLLKTNEKALLQVNDINHPYLPFIHYNDYFGYTNFELSYRKRSNLPPYTKEITLVFTVNNYYDSILKTMDNIKFDGQLFGPYGIDNHTVIFTFYGEANAIFDEFITTFIEKHKKIWKNKVEIIVGPYNK